MLNHSNSGGRNSTAFEFVTRSSGISRRFFAISMTICLFTASGVGYDENRAVQFAKLAGATYCSAESLAKWNCGDKCFQGVTDVKVCIGATTQAFVAQWDGGMVVSFQGTKTFSAMMQDAKFWKSGQKKIANDDRKVHTGFMNEWTSMKPCILEALSANNGVVASGGIRVTGHSLGAAVSVIAVLRFVREGWNVVEHYTYGMPRVGNKALAKDFSTKMQGRTFRITHHRDPVPHVPPTILHYKHTYPEIFYKKDRKDGWIECPDGENRTCSGKYWSVATDLLKSSDHLHYLDVDVSSVGCPKELSLNSLSTAMPRGDSKAKLLNLKTTRLDLTTTIPSIVLV